MIADDAAPRAARTVVFWNPPAARRGAAAPRERSRRRRAPPRRPRRPRPAHDLLHQEPEGGGADPPLRGRPARARAGRPALALPRRLHARAAAGDRAPARRRRAPRRDRDGRARARDRHRPPRLRDLGRLPGHRGKPAAAVGPRRAPEPRARSARGERGRPRPVLHARAGGVARAAGRGGDPRPRQPARPRRPRPRGGIRSAARRPRPRDPGRCRARAGRRPRRGGRAQTNEGGLRLGRPRLPGRPPLASLGERRGLRGRRRGDGHRPRARGARAAPTPRCTKARSTSTWASPTAFWRSTTQAAQRSWSRSPATTTRRSKKETTTAIEEAELADAAARHGRRLRPRQRDRAGGRLPEEVDPRPGDARSRPARPARDDASRPRRSGTSLEPCSSKGSTRCRGSSARSTPPSTR